MLSIIKKSCIGRHEWCAVMMAYGARGRYAKTNENTAEKPLLALLGAKQHTS